MSDYEIVDAWVVGAHVLPVELTVLDTVTEARAGDVIVRHRDGTEIEVLTGDEFASEYEWTSEEA